jgi:predicted DNA-binding transcriptional regulator AlpA
VAILPLKKIADRHGVSLRTLQRQLAEDDGPPVIQLSPRRVGIDEDDDDAWLASRRKPRPAPDVPAAVEAAQSELSDGER